LGRFARKWLGDILLLAGLVLIATAALGAVAISGLRPVVAPAAALSTATVAPSVAAEATATPPATATAPAFSTPVPTSTATPAATPAVLATETLGLAADASTAPAITPLAPTATHAAATATATSAPREATAAAAVAATAAAAEPTAAAAAATTTPDPAVASAGLPTRLVIPALGLDAPVVEVPLQNGTWDMQAITMEIAHLGATANPGQNSNVVLAGHVTIVGGIGPFYKLEQLQDGDQVTVYVGERAYTTHHLAPASGAHDVEIVQPTDQEQLTLITCTTWDAATAATWSASPCWPNSSTLLRRPLVAIVCQAPCAHFEDHTPCRTRSCVPQARGMGFISHLAETNPDAMP
jgi:LPXTG-site transpeptidase (sortase) family protein